VRVTGFAGPFDEGAYEAELGTSAWTSGPDTPFLRRNLDWIPVAAPRGENVRQLVEVDPAPSRRLREPRRAVVERSGREPSDGWRRAIDAAWGLN